jgi:hypothetical protein
VAQTFKSVDIRTYAGYHLRQARLKNLLKPDVSRRALSLNSKKSYYTEFWSFGSYSEEKKRFATDVARSNFISLHAYNAAGDKSRRPKFFTVSCSATSKYLST